MGISRIVEIVKDGDQGHSGYRKSFVGVGGGGVGFEGLWGFVVFVDEVGVEGVLGLAFQNQCSETFHDLKHLVPSETKNWFIKKKKCLF